MKIAIVCTMLNGFGRKGFYNSQEIGLGRAIAAHGHTVTIYKGVRMEETAETLSMGEGVTIQYIPMRRFGPHGYLKTSLLDPTLDAMLCFSDQQQFIPHIEAYCRRHGIVFVPYVGTAHSLHSGLRARVMDFLFSIGTLRLYHRMPVLAKTTAAREELLKLGAKDVRVANVGLDATELNHDYLNADRAQLKTSYGFEPDDVIICNVARLDPEKRPLELVELFDRVKEQRKFRLLIIGEGVMRPQLDEKIAALSLQDRVKVIPRVPYEKMWEIYTMSDYYLNLNRGEIFGMAVMEAVFYCCSVAASDALGPRTTLSGMKGHKLCPTDQDIESWLTAPSPAEADLLESSAKMIRDFSWNRCAEAFLAIAAPEKAAAAPRTGIPA
ncbi:MAG: glycosyltransferase family 4 protein [Clostridiales bacterium]|nr:glycosyltransferase family 4 protein [Clostridiales bacterium]